MDDAEPTVELSYEGSRLTLIRLAKLPPGDPCAGDLQLFVRAESLGFSGESRVWIASGEWGAFLTNLRELEARRRGEASVRAMSPREFDLAVRAIDRSGHIGVFGSVSRYTPTFDDPYALSVRFAFEICPTLLPAFVRDCESLGG